MLNKPIKKFVFIPKIYGIEVKREFVEGVIQILGTDGALMSTKPAPRTSKSLFRQDLLC